MSSQLANRPTRVLSILSVSPLEEDHSSLQAIVRHSSWNQFQARDLSSATSLLQQHDIAVVLCERDLGSGSWIDLLESTRRLPHSPSLIVTSRLADDRLWSEALNLGAWDVLVKPFDRTEVIRSVKSAWQHWHNPIQMLSLAMTGSS
jgi:DNA-binding NtrC family response regulator